MGRCMHEVSKNKDRTNEQNVAICLSTWRKGVQNKSVHGSEPLYRSAELEMRTLDTKERTVAFSFSSRNPVRRGIGGLRFKEVLSHDAGAVNTERFDLNAVPLLENHD